MAQTNISIRTDEDLKKDVEAIFAKLGLTLSAATNVFYRQVVMKQSIPFPLTTIGADLQTRKEFGEAFRAMQEESIANGTDEMILEDINEIISETRRELRTAK